MKEEQKAVTIQQQQLLEIEKQAVQALKNTFADIQHIDFEAIHYNHYTGSYRMLLTVANSKKQHVSFSIGYLQGDKQIEDYGVENEQVQVVGKTTNQVTVKYSNGKEAVV